MMSEIGGKGMAKLADKAAIATQEQVMPVRTSKTEMLIGVPKERGFQENRVALTPQSVKLLVANGHNIIIESKAGEPSFFTDKDYTEAGAKIVYAIEDVYKCSCIIRVGPIPEDEIEFLQAGQIIFSAIHLPTLTEQYLKALLCKKVIGVAYEYLRDQKDSLPIVRSMSEIAGSTSILIAAEYISNRYQGSGKLLGGVTGISPSRIVILGAGTVGEFAARTAIGLGAEVRVFDNYLGKLRRLQNNIGNRIYTSVIHPDILEYELMRADVAVGAIHAQGGRSPMIVSEDIVSKMKPGSIIIDVSIDQGGCFETSEITTHARPTFKKHGVIHYCVPNIPSRVSQTASVAMSNVMGPLMIEAGENGGFEEYMWLDKGLRCGIYCYNGNITNKYLSERYLLNFTKIELIASARF